MTPEEQLKSWQTTLAKLIRKRTGEKYTKVLRRVQEEYTDLEETKRRVFVERNIRDAQSDELANRIDHHKQNYPGTSLDI